jgi:hypothetical protein
MGSEGFLGPGLYFKVKPIFADRRTDHQHIQAQAAFSGEVVWSDPMSF